MSGGLQLWTSLVHSTPLALAVYERDKGRVAASPAFAAATEHWDLEAAYFALVRRFDDAPATAAIQTLTLPLTLNGHGSQTWAVRAMMWCNANHDFLAILDESAAELRSCAGQALLSALERSLNQARSAAARSGAHQRSVEAMLRLVNGAMCIVESDGRIGRLASPRLVQLLGADVIGRHVGEVVGGAEGLALDEIYRMYVVDPHFPAERLRSMSVVEWQVEGRRLGLRLEPVQEGGVGSLRWAVALIEDLTLLSRQALLDAITQDSRALMVLASTAPDVFRVAQQDSMMLVDELVDLSGQIALCSSDADGKIHRIRHLVHSLKSITASHAMLATTERLHAVEDALDGLDEASRVSALFEIIDVFAEISRVFDEVAGTLRVADARTWITVPADDYARYLATLTANGVQPALVNLARWLAFRPAAQLFVGAEHLGAEAQRRDKQVHVVVDAEDILLDLAQLSGLLEIIPHLARNALAHGVELPAIRRSRNKPARATIRFMAHLHPQALVVAVQDDGCGISAQAVAKRAAELGLEVPSQLNNVTILQLICHPAFSLAERSDDLAGRGQGMSAVADAVARLDAELRLYNEEGVGLRFEVIVANPPTKVLAVRRHEVDRALLNSAA